MLIFRCVRHGNHADLFQGPLIVLFVFLIFGQNLSYPELSVLRDLSLVIISHRDFPGVAPGIDHCLFDLRIGHMDRENFSVLHGDGQRLFTYKRLHTDQSPISGFHRLHINLRNLLFRQLRAVLALQPTAVLNLTNCGLVLNLTYIHQFRTAELHRSHICHELSRCLTDFHITQSKLRIRIRIYTILFCPFVGGVFLGIFRAYRPIFIRVRITNYTQHFYQVCK